MKTEERFYLLEGSTEPREYRFEKYGVTQKLQVNPMFHDCSKHLNTRHYFARYTVKRKLITVEYTPLKRVL